MEVLASVVLIGGVVTSALVAQATSVARLKTSEWQLIAADVAEELIANWDLDGVDLSTSDRGEAVDLEGWYWTRSSQQVELAGRVTATEITLEIAHRRLEDRRVPWRRQFRWLIEHEPK